ncbi:toxin ParE1/3/4 [Roseimicrobium gellanilyticum]|uniref:Toxin ParE1/3/4 n=2 Tax=Roseimicrobium gellanilyticum TaxID=748857 RepID=A0A366H4Y9_9BACT|nr:toxin ParE1/3/4 [Roseimicrobium gellanilyticum]
MLPANGKSMPRILRTQASKQDYNDIYSYIAADSPKHAANLLRKLDARLQVLSENNLMGRRRPELAEDLRSYPEGNYVIFYQPFEDGIILIRVLHSARDITADYFNESDTP